MSAQPMSRLTVAVPISYVLYWRGVFFTAVIVIASSCSCLFHQRKHFTLYALLLPSRRCMKKCFILPVNYFGFQIKFKRAGWPSSF